MKNLKTLLCELNTLAFEIGGKHHSPKEAQKRILALSDKIYALAMKSIDENREKESMFLGFSEIELEIWQRVGHMQMRSEDENRN